MPYQVLNHKIQTAACNMFRPKFSTKKASVWKAVHVGRHLCKKCPKLTILICYACREKVCWLDLSSLSGKWQPQVFSSIIWSTLQTNEWLTFTPQQASHKNYAIMNISLNLLQRICNKQPNYIVYLPIKCERYFFVMHVHLLLPWCTCIAKLSIS